MIDHILGRPSVSFRKYQVAAGVTFWSSYLLLGNRHGPQGIRRLSRFLTHRLSTWQTSILLLLTLYISRNFGKIIGLECPEPLANLYTRSYFRATYITTALDAGFWSAMHIRRKCARDIMSLICTVYYLMCAEQADEKVRKVRSVVTIEHLRVSWNKTLTPYLAFFTKLQRPRFTRYQPRALRIPRPGNSSYTEPVNAWLYFDGSLGALKKQTRVVLNIPGGGFVAMSPRTHDDSLLAWAGKTGLPVLSLDYGKAPQYPYPYALNECFDVYKTLVASRGRCMGLSGATLPQIVVSGDSAGGNLAAGMTLMILQAGTAETRRWLGQESLPPPAGLILIYPALDMNIGNWMTDEQMALIRDRTMRTTNRRVVKHKSHDFRKLAPKTPVPSDDEDEDSDPTVAPHKPSAKSTAPHDTTTTLTNTSTTSTTKPRPLRTRLAVPSLLTFFTDRILTPEMLRAMILLYIGPSQRPDFSTDHLLSPVLAPDSLLAAFPKTYLLTGERDPLVDDTVIFAGRLRQAKAAAWRDREELGLLSASERRRGFREKEYVDVKLVEGISHGFIQFASIFPEAWEYIHLVGRWYLACFEDVEVRERKRRLDRHVRSGTAREGEGDGNAGTTDADGAGADRISGGGRTHKRTNTGMSSGDEDAPLEMSVSVKVKGKKSPPPDLAHIDTNIARDGTVANSAHTTVDDLATTHSRRINVMEKDTHGRRSRRASFDDSIPPTPYSAQTPGQRSSGATSPEAFARGHPMGSRSRRGSGGGGGRWYNIGGGRRASDTGRRKSLVSLGSEDDLLGRRMRGLVGGLTRVSGES